MSMTAQNVLQRLAALMQSGASGESKLRDILRNIVPPLLGIAIFLGLWHIGASGVQTSLGALPGPAGVLEQAGNLYQEYRDEGAREAEFYKQQEARKAEEQRQLAQKQKEEAEKKRQAEAKRKQEEEQRRAEAERRKKDEAERRQAAEESLKQQIAAEERARAEAARAARAASEADKYKALIRQKVSRNWNRPAGTKSGLKCVVRVRLVPGGEVLQAQVVKSSGDPVFDRSVENAVYKAAPLPLPPDPDLFDYFREIEFLFSPEA